MATSQTKKKLAILFIGNSFTGRNDLPGLLAELAASASPAVTIETASELANGASLRQHWNKGAAIEKLHERPWDYVVLQEQSTLPIKNAGRYHENVRLFAEAIKKTGAKTVLYLTWARQHAPETRAALTEATQSIGAEVGALIAPVGIVWQELLAAHPNLTLHDKDGSHPSTRGTYLAACVFYATLLQKSPAGVVVPERLKLSPEDARLVQEAAWPIS